MALIGISLLGLFVRALIMASLPVRCFWLVAAGLSGRLAASCAVTVIARYSTFDALPEDVLP
jgi:hypothetical protein